VIPGAVDNGGEPPAAEYPCPAHHAVPVSPPAVGQHHNSPRRTFRIHAPDLQTAALGRGDLQIRHAAPIRRVMERFAGILLDHVSKKKRKHQIDENESAEGVEEGCHG